MLVPEEVLEEKLETYEPIMLYKTINLNNIAYKLCNCK